MPESSAKQRVEYRATGKRKTSVARVRLFSGKGKMEVNGRSLDDYFPRDTLKMLTQSPFEIVDMEGQFDAIVRVNGGGMSGQAGAVCHGITRALIKMDETLKPPLKKAGLVRRDPRMKERKKYGQKGARARFQFSKR